MVSITKDDVLISLTSGNATLTTVRGDFGFKLGSSVTSTESLIGAEWSDIASGKATYTSAYNRAYYSVTGEDENTISLSPESGKTQFEVEGLNSNLASVTDSAISVNGANVTIYENAFNKSTDNPLKLTNLNGAGYTFTTTEPTSAVSVSGTGEYNTNTKTYTATKWNAYYKPEDITNGKKFTYNASVGGETFEFTGLNQWSGVSVTSPYNDSGQLTVDGGSYGFTFGTAALNRTDVSITSDTAFTVSLGSGVDSVGEQITQSKTLANSLLTYQAAGTGEYYETIATGIDYHQQTGGEKFSLSGITNAEGVSVSGGTITVGKDALNMSATENYSVELTRGDDTNYFSLTFDGVATSASSVGESLTVAESVGTYTSGYTPAYLSSVTADEYTFTPQSGKTTFAISGLNDNASLGTNVTVSGNKVTLKGSALAPMNVSLSNDGYELTLDNAAPVSVAAGWEASGSGFAYNDSYISAAGHTVDATDKFKAEYVAATEKTGLFSLNGSAASLTGDSLKGVDVSGDNANGYTVKLSTDALPTGNFTDGTEVTLTKNSSVNSSLKLADGIATTKAQTSAAKLDGGKYTSAAFGAWYEAAVDKITCHPTTGGDELFRITGLASTAALNSNVTVTGNNVSLSSGAFGNNDLSISTGYTIHLSGATKNSLVSAKWSVDGGDVSFVSDYNTGGFNDTVGASIGYTNHTDATTFTISGLNVQSLTGGKVDGVSLGSSGEITLSGGAFSNVTEDATINLSGDEKYSLTLASGIDTAKSVSTAANWQPSSGDSINHVYTAAIYKPWFVLDSSRKKITRYAATGGEKFSISGVKNTDGVQVDGRTVTVAADALDERDVEISTDDYKLALADDVQPVKNFAAHWENFTYTAAGTTADYKLDDKKIVYVPPTGGEQFTISGVKSTNGITVEGLTVTVTADALDEQDVTISSDAYKLELAEDVQPVKNFAAHWTDFTYTSAGTTAGYKLVDEKIIYVASTGGEQFSISGVKNTDGVTVDGRTVIVAADALDEQDVTISSDAYKLALADDVQPVENFSAHWENFTYTAAGTTAGYKLDGKKIFYVPPTGGETFTISGVKVDGRTVTVSAEALDEQDVEISTDSYKLALADDVETVKNFAAHWENFTYTSAGTTAGYKLVGEKIVYVPSTGGEQFSISGVKSTDGVTVDGRTVTVNRSNIISGQEVAIVPDDYFALEIVGDDDEDSDRTDPARLIKKFTGIDVYTLDKIFNPDDAELNEAISARTVWLTYDGDGNADLSAAQEPQVVSLEGGRQNLEFNTDETNIAVVNRISTGKKISSSTTRTPLEFSAATVQNLMSPSAANAAGCSSIAARKFAWT